MAGVLNFIIFLLLKVECADERRVYGERSRVYAVKVGSQLCLDGSSKYAVLCR